MPTTYTYPGVYIEELPSGQNSITGVATSIAAFIGWSNQGPIGEAVMVESWTAYQNLFGGLIPGIYLGYAVFHFFENGGTQAYIIRLYNDENSVKNAESISYSPLPTSASAAASSLIAQSSTNNAISANLSAVTIVPTSGSPTAVPLYANNPGQWGNQLCVSVSNVQTASGGSQTFNLQVMMLNASGSTTTLENYINLSTSPSSPQWVVNVINSESNYITFTPPPAALGGGGSAPTSPLTVSATPTTTPAPPSPTPSTPLPLYVVAGTLTAGSFTCGQSVTQTNTQATGNVIGTVNSSFLVFQGAPAPAAPTSAVPVPPPVSGSQPWTAGTASFTPTTGPVLLPGVPLAFDDASPTTPTPAPTWTAGADGSQLLPNTAPFEFQLLNSSGLQAYEFLSSVPIFNLLCVPAENSVAAVSQLQQFCNQYRAFLIVDAANTAVVGTGSTGLSKYGPSDSTTATFVDQYASNSAFYFPWVSAPDPASGYITALFPPCGFVAGLYAATDATRGVWKAPAGIDASLTGAQGLQYVLNDQQNGLLNPMAVNCLRQFPNFGNVIWGARTIAGNDNLGSQYKYVPIRRLALYIESSLYAGTQWAVFEPNAEPLWGQVRLSIGTFMQGLFLQGAFAGTTPQTAYFVKCDADNNPDSSVALGILNIVVGFAPLYPAEFVVIQIQQMINQS
jgi:uncharacterized protein